MKDQLRTILEGKPAYVDLFFTAYIAYFEEKLSQSHDLLPLKNYKLVGRDLCAVGDFLDVVFDRYSLLCALSARMAQLRLSAPERSLVSALVPRCVVECSKDDGLWGYIVDPSGTSNTLTWLAEPTADTRLLQIITDATIFQKAYIQRLSNLLSMNDLAAAENLLFSSDNEIKQLRTNIPGLSEVKEDNSTHRLGLSEHLLQSLWTKKIIFPEKLITIITHRLAQYGIAYPHYVPELVMNDNPNALTIVWAIGNNIQ